MSQSKRDEKKKEVNLSMSVCAYCKASFSGQSQFCCHSCELLSNWVNDGHAPLEHVQDISDKWRKYNLETLENTFNFSNDSQIKKFRFYLEGLQCSSCVHLLEDFPQYCSDVISSKVDFSAHSFYVECKSTISLGTICQAIEQLGYIPTPLKEKSDYDLAKKNENRNDLKRIGVAGAVAGNAMLFSIPIYAGLGGELAEVFKWISFLIFLPVVLYVAIPFYKKAWASLLVRRVNVDMMIVVALISGFLFSTFNLIKHADEIYFDSTASFIFLILLTRYLLKYNQDKLLASNLYADLFNNEVFELNFDDGKAEYVTFDTIKKDQEFSVKKDQLLPCDAKLLSIDCDFDLSYLTGESLPQSRSKGDTVLAGSRLLNKSAQLICETPATESLLAQSLNRIEFENKSKNEMQTLSDLVSHRLTLAVFSVAALFFIATYHVLGFEAFKRCLALITIACPCAVAFGTPLAQSLGLKRASKNGFFIKSAVVFEKLTDIKKIIFDKTGTLTSSQLALVKTVPNNLSDKYKSIILGLEKLSLHPVALTLKHIWSGVPLTELINVTETKSIGVQSLYSGHQYRLAKAPMVVNSQALQVDFSIDEKVVSSLYFDEQIKPEVPYVLGKFKSLGYSTVMLTGDRLNRAKQVADEVGLELDSVFAEKSATDKEQFIQKQNPCLYVGDGLNDIGALSKAHVSFAIKGTFESTLQVSDIYAPKKDLNSILEIIQLSKKVQSTVRCNLAFALFYNFIGGAFALLGFINPLVAAILMPISSFAITAHTVWRFR